MTDATPITASLPMPAAAPPRAPGYMRLHLWLYRFSGGKIGSRFMAHQFLLLTTTGRRSGMRYTVPLEYHTDGSLPYVIGSNYGKDHPPAWYFNILANATVEIELNGQRRWAYAQVADALTRQRLWPELARVAPYYERYQRGVTREIPLVLLHPLA